MQTALIIACLSLGAFVRGAVGFADALVAMPLLLLIVPADTAAPQMAMISLLIALLILRDGWKEVEWKVALALIIPGLPCVPIGIFLTQYADPAIGRMLLGFVLILFAVWSLLKPDLLQLKTDVFAPAFGITAGLLGGAYNTGGPPLVFYSALRRWNPDRFRATMQVYAFSGSSWIILMHARVGHLTKPMLWTLLLAAPCIVIAVALGKKLTAGLPPSRFIKATHGLLIVLGLLLIMTAANEWLNSDPAPPPLEHQIPRSNSIELE